MRAPGSTSPDRAGRPGDRGPRPGGPLRIALLGYRSNPRSGGQGVYLRHLSRELTEMGHRVTVVSGPPYPDLVDGVDLLKLPSLELYVPPGPFRTGAYRRIRTAPDITEFAMMFSGHFPEPRTFTWRARLALTPQRHRFDVVHDNQSLGAGLLGLQRRGWPVLATVHHPITVDLEMAIEHAASKVEQDSIRRWYSFAAMQARVARALPSVLTVSETSRNDIVEAFGIDPTRVSVVAVGTDPHQFRPLPGVQRVAGRIVTTASADVPLKGLVPLLEALAKVRTEREDAELVVVGRLDPDGRVAAAIERLGLEVAVRFESDVPDHRLVELYAEAAVAVVPSLYEGFSLPAVEAMSCAVPLVATTGGALPEVVGPSGGAGLLVPPDDPGALAAALLRVLGDPALGCRLGDAGRARVLERYTWRRTAIATADQYHRLLATTGHGRVR